MSWALCHRGGIAFELKRAHSLPLPLSPSLSLPLPPSPLDDRRQLVAMWKLCEVAGMCQDEFEMILTEQVKRALAKKEAGLEDRVMAVVIQRLVGPKDQRTRFIANDLGHMPPSGPEVLVLFSTRKAREKAQGLPVLLWFGQDETEDYHLLKIDTNFKRVEQSQVAAGLGPAKSRLLKKVQEALGSGPKILQLVAEAAEFEIEQLAQADAGSAKHSKEARQRLQRLNSEVLAGHNAAATHDQTAAFVLPVITQELMHIAQHPGNRDKWQALADLTVRMQKEIEDRRRKVGPPFLVVGKPFPDPKVIWADGFEEKRALRQLLGGLAPEQVLALESFFRKSDTFSFLQLEPIGSEKHTLDLAAGIVFALQSADQLVSGDPLFQEASGSMVAGAPPGWEHATLLQSGANIQRLPSIQIQTQQNKQPIATTLMPVKILATDNGGIGLPDSRRAMQRRLEEMVREGDGVWVPVRQSAGELVIVKPEGELRATQLSELANHPEFLHYIKNIPSWVEGADAQDCAGALEVIGELQSAGEILPVKYNENWLIYVASPLAREIEIHPSVARDGPNWWAKFVVIGASVREAILGTAREILHQLIRDRAAGGIWLEGEAAAQLRTDGTVMTPPPPNKPTQREGSRWLDKQQTSALVVMAERLQDPKMLGIQVQAILEADNSLTVLKGADDTALLLFSETISMSQLKDNMAKPGFSLPELPISMSGISGTIEKLMETMQRAAQERGRNWKFLETKASESKQWVIHDAKKTFDILAAQHEKGPATPLLLTREEIRNLESDLNQRLAPLTVIRGESPTGDEWHFRMDPKGPGLLSLSAKGPMAIAENVELPLVRAEWPPAASVGQTAEGTVALVEALKETMPALAYGTALARILQFLADKGRIIVIEESDEFLIVLPEAGIDGQGHMGPAVSWKQQFNVEAEVLKSDIGKHIRRRTGDDTVSALVQWKLKELSHYAVIDMVTAVLRDETRPVLLPGVTADTARGRVNLQLATDVPHYSDLNLQLQVLHPAMDDERFLGVVQSALADVKPFVRMIAVGPRGNDLLVFPHSSTHQLTTWADDDARFKQWTPEGDAAFSKLLQLPAPTSGDTAMPSASNTAKKRSHTASEATEMDPAASLKEGASREEEQEFAQKSAKSSDQ